MPLVPAWEGCLELIRLAASVHGLDNYPVLCQKKALKLQIVRIYCECDYQSRLVSLGVGGVRINVYSGQGLSLSFVSSLGSEATIAIFI